MDPASSNTNSPSVQRVLRDHDYYATYSTLRNDHANNANTPLAAVYNDHAYTTTQYPTRMSAGHVCDSCGRTFTRRNNLVVHVRNKRCSNFLQKRISKSQYACETCGKLFVARKSLTRHKKTGRCDVIAQPPLPKRSKLAQCCTARGRHRGRPKTAAARRSVNRRRIRRGAISYSRSLGEYSNIRREGFCSKQI